MSEKTPHRSFTVRTELDLYCQMAEIARKERVSLNVIVNRLIRTGLTETVNINDRLAELLENNVLPQLKATTNE